MYYYKLYHRACQYRFILSQDKRMKKSNIKFRFIIDRFAIIDYNINVVISGSLVKWLRHGPFTAVTGVRVPYESESLIGGIAGQALVKYGAIAKW